VRLGDFGDQKGRTLSDIVLGDLEMDH
jgi:hypothetical protein